jgi:RHS repeat-associated protein
VTEGVPNPFRYIGAVWDSSTGLYQMGERYYDPSTARFTQEDPLGGGFGYAAGDPINLVDPSGLMESKDIYEEGVGPKEAPVEGPKVQSRGRFRQVRGPRDQPQPGSVPKGFNSEWRAIPCRRETGRCFADPNGGWYYYHHEDNHHWSHWDYYPEGWKSGWDGPHYYKNSRGEEVTYEHFRKKG